MIVNKVKSLADYNSFSLSDYSGGRRVRIKKKTQKTLKYIYIHRHDTRTHRILSCKKKKKRKKKEREKQRQKFIIDN